MEILVGNKPVKNYLVYSLTALSRDNTLVIKARGRSISKAVDLAEILKRQSKGLKQGSIVIGTEVVHDKDKNRDVRVSTIELTLTGQRTNTEISNNIT